MNVAAPSTDILFHEDQQFRQPWVWVVLLVVTVVVVVVVAVGHSWWLGLIVLLLDLAMAGLLYSLKLTTQVRDDGVHLRFSPLVRQSIPFGQIGRSYVRTYRPILEYGGWGVRYGWKGKAFNVRGNRGVQLELLDGKRLLIGSQRPEELAQAIAGATMGGAGQPG